MGVLNFLWFVFGVVIGAGAVVLGAYLTVRVGKHFIDNYVQKLTADDLKTLNNTRTLDIDDEQVWASAMTRDELERKIGLTDPSEDRPY